MKNALPTITEIRAQVKTTTETGTISHAYIKPGTRRSIVVWAERHDGEGREFATAKAAKAWLAA
jgi:hypothetical protein